ncbi:APC family permease [Pseudovibrio flavus]|uniref:APC family permease n=1 Tax=Pseudovibrio flavus TaxID=2529854 RepID=UPI00211BE74C|nr:APC family permease [Pseudovibrio flavus]
MPPGSKHKSSGTGHLSVIGVASLGVGSMVGVGVFALLGQVALNVRSETWLVFVVAGIAALFSGYSYACLSAKYPSSGGITDYLRLGFGWPLFERALSILYLFTLVLTLALIAKAFGAYASGLFHKSVYSMWQNLYATGVLLAMLAINLVGAALVGKVEVVLVALKIFILGIFIVAGMTTINPEMLDHHLIWEPASFFSSIGLAFFAYAGYGMMATAAGDVRNPKRDMPIAFFVAICFVMALYVVLAFVVLGNVTPVDLVLHPTTTVARAAEPVLGKIGYPLMSITALFATASAINATLFASLNVSLEMGKAECLPAIFRQTSFGGGTRGLYLLVLFILLAIAFLDLSSIATVASATFLACYLAVFVVAWRHKAEIEANPLLLGIGFLLMLGILGAFIGEMIGQAQWTEIGLLAGTSVVSLLTSYYFDPEKHKV